MKIGFTFKFTSPRAKFRTVNAAGLLAAAVVVYDLVCYYSFLLQMYTLPRSS